MFTFNNVKFNDVKFNNVKCNSVFILLCILHTMQLRMLQAYLSKIMGVL